MARATNFTEILPFLRENGQHTYNRLRMKFGSLDAFDLAHLTRDGAIKSLRIEKELPLEEIAEIFGLTRERIRQLTPPELWYSRAKEEEISRVTLEAALKKATTTPVAWMRRGTLKRSWLQDELNCGNEAEFDRVYKPREEYGHKFLLILQYGLGLQSKEEMLDWMNRQYWNNRHPYGEIAKRLSQRFVPISTMQVWRVATDELGFVGRSRGRYEDDYTVGAEEW